MNTDPAIIVRPAALAARWRRGIAAMIILAVGGCAGGGLGTDGVEPPRSAYAKRAPITIVRAPVQVRYGPTASGRVSTTTRVSGRTPSGELLAEMRDEALVSVASSGADRLVWRVTPVDSGKTRAAAPIFRIVTSRAGEIQQFTDTSAPPAFRQLAVYSERPVESGDVLYRVRPADLFAGDFPEELRDAGEIEARVAGKTTIDRREVLLLTMSDVVNEASAYEMDAFGYALIDLASGLPLESEVHITVTEPETTRVASLEATLTTTTELRSVTSEAEASAALVR